MNSWLILTGRIFMSAFFLTSAYWHLAYWEMALTKTSATQVFYPEIILLLATILLALGGISLLLGYKTKIGCFLLIVEILFSALIFNNFWAYTGVELQIVLLAFLSRIALCGGLLFLVSHGAGRFSIDGYSKTK